MLDIAQEDSPTLIAVKGMTAEITQRSDEIEANRAVPADLIERLREAGLFRMMIPKKYGGDALHMLQVSRVLEELSRADASVGWTGMVAVGWNKFITHFPLKTLEQMFAVSPDVYFRGAIAPKGAMRRVEGGYMVNGRWQLASGSFPHKYMVCNGLLVDDAGAPVITDGRPQLVAAIIPADHAELVDTWRSLGLRGSASHDFIVKDYFAPDDMTGNLFGTTTMDSAIHRLTPDVFTSPTHGSVSVGIAQGALDDFCDLARNKRPVFGGGKRMAEDPILAYRVGQVAVRLNGLRAQLERMIVEAWDIAHEGGGVPPTKRAEVTAVSAHIQHEAVDLVNELFAMAGTSPVYDGGPLQRRWRDVRVVAQHIAANQNNYGLLGAALMGEDIGGRLI